MSTYRYHLVDFNFPAREVRCDFLLSGVSDPLLWVRCPFASWNRDERDPVKILPMGDRISDDVLSAPV